MHALAHGETKNHLLKEIPSLVFCFFGFYLNRVTMTPIPKISKTKYPRYISGPDNFFIYQMEKSNHK